MAGLDEALLVPRSTLREWMASLGLPTARGDASPNVLVQGYLEPRSHLTRVYETKFASARRAGAEVIGADALVEALRSHRGERVAIFPIDWAEAGRLVVTDVTARTPLGTAYLRQQGPNT